MNYTTFDEWRADVLEINKRASDIIHQRKDMYNVLSDEIKKVFSRNEIPVENIHFSSDGSLITVYIKDAKDTIRFNRNFLINIGMTFSVCRELTNKGENRLYLELYPFDDYG